MLRRTPPLTRFEARLSVTLRLASKGDLRPLEWFGWFTPHRVLIEEAFARQVAGEVFMLLAIVGGFPIGQIWIDLTRKSSEGVGVLWALRVQPGFQGLGVATALIFQAETLLRKHGRPFSEVGVEPANDRARRLYERLGYVLSGSERELVRYVTPSGKRRTMKIDQCLFRRCLTEDSRDGTHVPHHSGERESPLAQAV